MPKVKVWTTTRVTALIAVVVGLLLLLGWLLQPKMVQPAPPFSGVSSTKVLIGVPSPSPPAKAESEAVPNRPSQTQERQPATPARVDILVQGPDGLPRSGARVWLLSLDDSNETGLGTTGDGGLVTAGYPFPSGSKLAIRCPGFVTEYADSSSLVPVGGRITIALRVADVISGLLVDPDNRPLGERGTVAIWRVAHESLTQGKELLQAVGDGATLAILSTDETGSFRFAEAEPNVQYRFAATSSGRVSAMKDGGVLGSSAGPEVRIPLDNLYVVVVRVRDAAGGPIDIPADEVPKVNQSLAGLDVAGFETVWGLSVGCQLGAWNLPRPGLSENGEFVSVWHLRRMGNDASPLNFHFRTPNYELTSIQVVPQEVSGELEQYVVSANAHPRGPTGSVKLRLEVVDGPSGGTQALASRLSCMGALLNVGLTPIDGHGRVRTKDLVGASPEHLEFAKVEVGTYRVDVMSRGRRVRTEATPDMVIVEEGRVATGSVKVRTGSCILLSVRDAQDRPVTGRVSVEVEWGSTTVPGVGQGRYTDRIVFFAPPYQIAFAPVGQVDLSIDADAAGVAKTTVVVPGEGVLDVGVKCRPKVR